MSRTSKTNISIKNNGVLLGSNFNIFDFDSNISASDLGNGAASINATSSGSGFQTPSSGVVDGVNLTFVFATAPNVVIVDQGRAMQKVSSDGTINWTGTTTVVLTIAPTSDIYSTS